MIYFEDNLRVRYYETDKMGIVHHSNYIRFFECARLSFMEKMGFGIEKFEEAGIVLPIVEIKCNYKYPTTVGEKLRVTVEIQELPKARFKLHQNIYNEKGVLCASGYVVSAFMNTKTNRVQSCPEEFYKILEEEFKKG